MHRERCLFCGQKRQQPIREIYARCVQSPSRLRAIRTDEFTLSEIVIGCPPPPSTLMMPVLFQAHCCKRSTKMAAELRLQQRRHCFFFLSIVSTGKLYQQFLSAGHGVPTQTVVLYRTSKTR